MDGDIVLLALQAVNIIDFYFSGLIFSFMDVYLLVVYIVLYCFPKG